MPRTLSTGRPPAGAGLALALAVLVLSGGADGGSSAASDFDIVAQPARLVGRMALAWYQHTPPADRVTWGGLAASTVLGLVVLVERVLQLRRGRIIPRDFAARFVNRLRDGKLDRGKALDFCELNPSPAARVALGAVRRWDRPVADQERAVAMTCRVESDRLRRNVGTLRRIAALAPLIGLFGTLVSAGRALSALRPDVPGLGWGPMLGAALTPLTTGVALAILALVAYDGLVGRIEKLVGTLERLGADTVDAIAMAVPVDPRVSRTPHSQRVDLPDPHVRGGGGRADEFV